jgi:DNA-binding transcriptional LysR family regulator
MTGATAAIALLPQTAFPLPQVVGRYHARHPAITLSLDIANTEEIVARLREYRDDLVLVEGPVSGDDLTVRPYRDDTLVLIIAPTHPLARKGARARWRRRRCVRRGSRRKSPSNWGAPRRSRGR